MNKTEELEKYRKIQEEEKAIRLDRKIAELDRKDKLEEKGLVETFFLLRFR